MRDRMSLSYSHFDFRFLKRDSITWFNSTFENVKCLIMAPLNQANLEGKVKCTIW